MQTTSSPMRMLKSIVPPPGFAAKQQEESPMSDASSCSSSPSVASSVSPTSVSLVTSPLSSTASLCLDEEVKRASPTLLPSAASESSIDPVKQKSLKAQYKSRNLQRSPAANVALQLLREAIKGLLDDDRQLMVLQQQLFQRPQQQQDQLTHQLPSLTSAMQAYNHYIIHDRIEARKNFFQKLMASGHVPHIRYRTWDKIPGFLRWEVIQLHQRYLSGMASMYDRWITFVNSEGQCVHRGVWVFELPGQSHLIEFEHTSASGIITVSTQGSPDHRCQFDVRYQGTVPWPQVPVMWSASQTWSTGWQSPMTTQQPLGFSPPIPPSQPQQLHPSSSVIPAPLLA